MKKLLALVLSICPAFLNAQLVVHNPAVAEISHPELHITKITFDTNSTIFYMHVENKRNSGGWFCTDKKMYVENPQTHQRYWLRESIDVPNCPNVHSFKNADETLDFRLIFEAIPTTCRTLHLVEDCQQSCFFFKNIILDAKLNEDIITYEKGMELYQQNHFAEAIAEFTRVVMEIPPFPTHVYGYSYYHLITINRHIGNSAMATFWLEQLECSTLPDKQYFIDNLQKQRNAE